MQKLAVKIAPSILSGDFGHLADEAKRIEASGADYLHLDVMDGHFVPNLTFGFQAVAAINRATDMFLDVHIMVYNPFDYVERMVEAGADRLTFHFEATEEVEEVLNYIRRCNIEAGISFRPETSKTLVLSYLNKCDSILLMTVDPGFGGQTFQKKMLEKIRFTREMATKLNLSIDIEVDGGINPETAKLCHEAGANVFVSGNYLFQCEDMKEGVRLLREAAKEASVPLGVGLHPYEHLPKEKKGKKR